MRGNVKRLEEVWPDWQSVELIGQGSYGKVYKIKKSFNGKEIYSALKILDIPQDDSVIREYMENGMDNLSIISIFQNQIKSLENEILILENLRSAPNIVNIEDYFIDKSDDSIHSRVFIRMELLKSLPEYMKEGSPDQNEVVKMGMDLCQALIACERDHIIHRDIKPGNIFVTRYGDYKLGDFGLARQLEASRSAFSVVGTPGYEAPEVMRKSGYDQRADIYSLGMVMYFYLNHKRLPFLPPYPQKIKIQDINMANQQRLSGKELPTLEDYDDTLMEIVQKACAFEPQLRFQSAKDFYQALKNWSEGKKTKVEEATVYRKDINYTCVLSFLESVSGCEKKLNIPYHKVDGSSGIRKVRLKFLPGIVSGICVPIANMGNCMADGTVGDLYITSLIPKDQNYSRTGNDIIYHLYIDRKNKKTIGNIDVSYAIGKSVNVHIPAHIRDNMKITIREKGITQGGKTGDLYVVIHLTGRKTLLEKFKNFWSKNQY